MTIEMITNETTGLPVLKATKRGCTNVFGWVSPQGVKSDSIGSARASFASLNITLTARDMKQMEKAIDAMEIASN